MGNYKGIDQKGLTFHAETKQKKIIKKKKTKKIM